MTKRGLEMLLWEDFSARKTDGTKVTKSGNTAKQEGTFSRRG